MLLGVGGGVHNESEIHAINGDVTAGEKQEMLFGPTELEGLDQGKVSKG